VRISGGERGLDHRQEPIKVLLADAQSLVREAVRSFLDGRDDIEVVAEASDGMQAVAEAERTRPDVALVDADLPNRDSTHTTLLIRERTPGCRVLVLSDRSDEATLATAMEFGASGFLTKGSPLTELLEAVHAVHAGDTLVPPRMLGSLLQRLIHRRREQDDAVRQLAKLTRRERQVLGLLARGADNDRIAQALVISPETARTHVQHVLTKLGMHSRLAVAAFVVANGLAEELVVVDA
jgi:DNA-binding NarL/FixJ family response regulator